MKTALVISSFVGASHVGATASAFCLRRLGIETSLLPTTLFGRHPGWGTPGGDKTGPALLRDMWTGIKAQNIPFDAVMTGYMGDPDHVVLSADIIRHVKTLNPDAHILVDPVMGDAGRLYVSEEIAQAIKSQLLSLADTVTPNLWELSYLSGKSPHMPKEIAACAIEHLPCHALVTSVTDGPAIGALWASQSGSFFIRHTRFDDVPNGGGDALAGTFLAHRLCGLSPAEAMARAGASIFAIIKAAKTNALGELPLISEQDSLENAPPLKVITL